MRGPPQARGGPDSSNSTGITKGMEMTSTTIAQYENTIPAFDDAALTSIVTFEDASALLVDSGIAVERMSDYGTGFKLVDSKTLQGTDFLIVQWRFNAGAFGEAGFVSVEAITKHNEKVIFNDGSTGIRDQLRVVTAQRIESKHSHPQAGLIVMGGLTASEYFFNSDTGEISRIPMEGKNWKPATTYYLAG